MDLTQTLSNHKPYLDMIRDLVNNNLSNSNYNYLNVIEDLGTNRSSLYRKVKQKTGHSPAIYIRFLRLESSKILLTNTELTIAEIAYKVGFNDHTYFTRSFTKTYSLSPIEYRKKHFNKNNLHSF